MEVFREGDIVTSSADAIVNPVNCVGVMGRGLALQFKNAFPESFRAYKQTCDAKQLEPGVLAHYERLDLGGFASEVRRLQEGSV